MSMPSMFNKLKEVKDLRSQAKEVKNVLADISATGSAMGGKIQVHMDGNQEIQSVEIDKEALDPSNQVKMQEGVRDAVNGAVKQIQKTMAKKMRAGELEMPDMDALKG